MRCLVTGAAGFIGSHLCERLLDLRAEVVAIDSFTDFYSRRTKRDNIAKSMNNAKFSFIHENLLTVDLYSALTGVDYVFHLAAQAGVRPSWGKEFKLYNDYNVMATQRLLEVAKNFNLKKFVYASSSSVYGDTTDLPMKEDSLLRPASPYGVTKLCAERLVGIYNSSFNLPTVSLRFFTVYGPRQRPDMAFNKFITAIQNDEKIPVYGDGEQTLDFTYVSYVIDAIVAAATEDVTGEVFNIGCGSTITVNKVISIIEKGMKMKANIEYMDKQKGDVLHTRASISKAKRMLGYAPKVKLPEGIAHEIDWLRGGHNAQ